MYEIFLISIGVAIGVIFEKQIKKFKERGAAAVHAASNEFKKN